MRSTAEGKREKERLAVRVSLGLAVRGRRWQSSPAETPGVVAESRLAPRDAPGEVERGRLKKACGISFCLFLFFHF